jgi:hypothetical protein
MKVIKSVDAPVPRRYSLRFRYGEDRKAPQDYGKQSIATDWKAWEAWGSWLSVNAKG